MGKRKYGATSAKRRKFWATSCCGLWDLGMQLDSLTSFVKIVLFCHIPFSSLSALSIFFAFLHITFQLFSPSYSWSNLLPKSYLLYLTLERIHFPHSSFFAFGSEASWLLRSCLSPLLDLKSIVEIVYLF